MESQVIFESEAHLHPENIAVREGEHSVASFTPAHVVPLQPGILLQCLFDCLAR